MIFEKSSAAVISQMSFLHVEHHLIKFLLHSGQKSEILGYVDLSQTSAPTASFCRWWFRPLLFVVIGEGVPALCLCLSDVQMGKKHGCILNWMHSSHRGLALFVSCKGGLWECPCVCVCKIERQRNTEGRSHMKTRKKCSSNGSLLRHLQLSPASSLSTVS